MYAGRIMERAPKAELIRRQLHPYTMGVIRSQPGRAQPGKLLESIEGQLPSLNELPEGCRFHPRCTHAVAACKSGEMPFEVAKADHIVGCIRWRELSGAA